MMNTFLFQAVAAAPASTTAQVSTPIATEIPAAKKQSAWGSIGFMVLLFVVLYFLMIRPNQKREKAKKEKIASLMEGDKVISIGGIKGVVVSVKEDTVVIKSKGTEIELVKAAINHIVK